MYLNVAFSNSEPLRLISVAASLAVIAAGSHPRFLIERVVIDELSPHYCISAGFMFAFKGMWLIRLFGDSDNVKIRRIVDALGKFCFGQSKSSIRLRSRLTRFGKSAFSEYSALKSTYIAAHIEYASKFCFLESCALNEIPLE
jgi:hypothetical protein